MLWNPDKVRDPEYSGHHISALSLHEVALFVADHQLVFFSKVTRRDEQLLATVPR